MDNKSIATVLYETADLLEIDGQDSFRIRSYRNAAQAIENHTEQIRDIIGEPKKVLAIPGIGKGMLANLQELLKDGQLTVQAELLKKYHPSMLQLLKIQGLGPKTIALIWSAYQVCDVDGVEKLAREGKIRELPRMGEKHEQKLLKAIEDLPPHLRPIPDRRRRDRGEKTHRISCEIPRLRQDHASRIVAPRPRDGRRSRHSRDRNSLLQHRGAREVAAICCEVSAADGRHRPGRQQDQLSPAQRLQVDVRLLPPESFGAAMQYFTGSKAHNVALRQRALKMGYTLNEYSLANLEDREAGRRQNGRRDLRQAQA